MYPDDSLTLHTDLYQINMMQVYFDQGIHNKKRFLRSISVSNRSIMAMRFLLVWKGL